jgi:cobalt-zinc-cadmium resistance protein CzcA
MFKPMAMTFSFALVGAMIFAFTYVPVVFIPISKTNGRKSKSLSSRLIRG